MLDIRVTQIVKAHPAQTVTLQKFRKCVGQVFHPHPLAQLIHEYKAIVFIVVAVAADLLVQLLRLFHLHKVFPEAADESGDGIPAAQNTAGGSGSAEHSLS